MLVRGSERGSLLPRPNAAEYFLGRKGLDGTSFVFAIHRSASSQSCSFSSCEIPSRLASSWFASSARSTIGSSRASDVMSLIFRAMLGSILSDRGSDCPTDLRATRYAPPAIASTATQDHMTRLATTRTEAAAARPSCRGWRHASTTAINDAMPPSSHTTNIGIPEPKGAMRSTTKGHIVPRKDTTNSDAASLRFDMFSAAQRSELSGFGPLAALARQPTSAAGRSPRQRRSWAAAIRRSVFARFVLGG